MIKVRPHGKRPITPEERQRRYRVERDKQMAEADRRRRLNYKHGNAAIGQFCELLAEHMFNRHVHADTLEGKPYVQIDETGLDYYIGFLYWAIMHGGIENSRLHESYERWHLQRGKPLRDYDYDDYDDYDDYVGPPIPKKARYA